MIFIYVKSDQDKLNDSTENPLLKGRGLPGTHELSLLVDTFNKLINNYKQFKSHTWKVKVKVEVIGK